MDMALKNRFATLLEEVFRRSRRAGRFLVYR